MAGPASAPAASAAAIARLMPRMRCRELIIGGDLLGRWGGGRISGRRRRAQGGGPSRCWRRTAGAVADDRRSGVEEGTYGEHAPVAAAVGGQAELVEDRGHVTLDGALGEEHAP